MKATGYTGEDAMLKLERICEILANKYPIDHEIWDLIDGVGDAVTALDKAAFFRVQLPWRRKAHA